MASSFLSAFRVLGDSITVLVKFPIFFLPLIFSWMVFFGVLLAFSLFDFSKFGVEVFVAAIFLAVFVFSFTFTFCCTLVLEFIQQVETGFEVNFFSALKETFEKDFFKIVPLSFFFVPIWLLLTFLEVLVFLRPTPSKGFYAPGTIAEKLKALEDVSIASIPFKGISRGLRMLSFLSLPAIAWEDKSFSKSIKRGYSIFMSQFSEFMSSFALAEVALFFVLIPIAVFLALNYYVLFLPLNIVLSWVVCFCVFMVSFLMFLELIFSATLFLWHLKWEKSFEDAVKAGKPLPRLIDVPRPTILDNIPDLVNIVREKQVILGF